MQNGGGGILCTNYKSDDHPSDLQLLSEFIYWMAMGWVHSVYKIANWMDSPHWPSDLQNHLIIVNRMTFIRFIIFVNLFFLC